MTIQQEVQAKVGEIEKLADERGFDFVWIEAIGEMRNVFERRVGPGHADRTLRQLARRSSHPAGTP